MKNDNKRDAEKEKEMHFRFYALDNAESTSESFASHFLDSN